MGQLEKIKKEDDASKVTAEEMVRKWKAPLLSSGSRQPFIVPDGELKRIDMSPTDSKAEAPEILEESWTLTKDPKKLMKLDTPDMPPTVVSNCVKANPSDC